MSILTKNWHTWYIGGVNSESGLRYLRFQPQNLFLGKFWPKNSKLSVLSENWCTKFRKDADSKSRLIFLKFRLRNLFLGKFEPKNYCDNSFLNCQPLIHSWANLGWKNQSYLYCLKTGKHSYAHAVPRSCWFLFQY